MKIEEKIELLETELGLYFKNAIFTEKFKDGLLKYYAERLPYEDLVSNLRHSCFYIEEEDRAVLYFSQMCRERIRNNNSKEIKKSQ